MDVVVLAGAKGGPGKSTVATNLAVAAREDGRRVLLVDADPQRTTVDWYRDRESDEPGVVAAPFADDIGDAVQRARAADYDIVVIDTPGRDDLATAAAMRAADLVLVV